MYVLMENRLSPSSALKVACFSKSNPTLSLGFRTKGKDFILQAFMAQPLIKEPD